MAFNDTKNDYNQQHFTIIEIDVPIVTGECTIGGSAGYGTALTCDQPSNGIKTYKFTTTDAPLLPVSEVWRCIESITETPTELKSGRGIADRGTISITMADFQGDPNPLAPAVTDEVKNQGEFLAKLDARNVLQNRNIRIKNYRIGDDGHLPDLDEDAETRYYIIRAFDSAPNRKWRVSGKDELSRFDIGEKVWPEDSGGYLRVGVDDDPTSVIFQVDPDVSYAVDDVIRIGDELSEIVATSNIGTGTANIQVGSRDSTSIIAGLSRTDVSSHNGGSEIFVCRTYIDARIDTVLYGILTEVGVDSSLIPLSEWQDEIDIWHPDTKINYIFTESMDANDVISLILKTYMIDMWFDQVERKVKISAVSTWRSSVAVLEEGNQINFDSVRIKQKDDLRATDALVVYNKLYLARDDSTENYVKASTFSNPLLSTDAYYGEPKQKRFDNNPIADTTAADLLVRRYVYRYGITPIEYTFKVEEKKLNFVIGDVVDLKTYAKVGFDGLPSGSARGQIISIKPNYNTIGRQYTVKALTYDPAITSGGGGTGGGVNEIILTGTQNNINLYVEAGGAIPEAVEITFILDAVKVGSVNASIPSIRAGSFPTGSKLTIILINGTDWQGKGGQGGNGASLINPDTGFYTGIPPTNGQAGGVCYDAQGIDTDIYLSGSTGNASYPTADGYLRAAGGGGGGAAIVGDNSGDGGGGGAGRNGGAGGKGGFSDEGVDGRDGETGKENGIGGSGNNGGTGGGWGEAGENAASLGGAAGKGVVKSGATVNVYGGTSARFINGNGD